MKVRVVVREPSGYRYELVVDSPAVLGRASECNVPLKGWRIARQHARIDLYSEPPHVEDLGALSGLNVKGVPCRMGINPYREGDVIELAGYVIQCHAHRAEDTDGPSLLSKASPMSVGSTQAVAVTDANLPPLPSPKLGMATPSLQSPPTALSTQLEAHYRAWQKRLHEWLIQQLDLRRRDVASMSDDQLRREAAALLDECLRTWATDLPHGVQADVLHERVLHEAVGLGPLEPLLKDASVSEIMVNRFDEIFVETQGRLIRHPSTFSNERAVMGVIERIVAPLGRRIDESSPTVDARLKDGSRVNAVIPPLALKGPCLTIRKFPKSRLSIQDLVDNGSLTSTMARFLQTCVWRRKNLLVSGGTGSGKTTLLNVLSRFIPGHERIITIEDAAELQLNHAHFVSLEARPSNAEGRGEVSIRDLVRNALRMRPDRIVIGECRGAEALDMLQAMNTGHEGSLSTLHANTPRDALARLETMVLMAGLDLPLAAIREQIASAVDVIIQQTRLSDGRRLVTHITELSGMESGIIQMQDIFVWQRGSGHQPTGLLPLCLHAVDEDLQAPADFQPVRVQDFQSTQESHS